MPVPLFQQLPPLQVEVAGLDKRMVALSQQQAHLQAALGRKQSLSKQLTKV